MTPRVSIVTRTKDRPLLLERAFRSILGQSFGDFEMIIVNDAGEVAPVEALMTSFEAEAQGRVRLITNEVSNGREAAMNTGFDAARGEFIILHDDDDSWAPEFLEQTVAHLEANPKNGGVAVRTEVVFEHIDGDEIVEEEREILASDMHEVLLGDIIRRSTVPPISFIFRREVYERVGHVRGDLPVLADWEFLLRFLIDSPVGFIDGEPLAFWHQRRASTGADGNSVIVDAADHADYNGRIRDDFLRQALRGATGSEGAGAGAGTATASLGELLFQSKLIDDVERNAANSRRQVGELLGEGQRAQAKHIEAVRGSVEGRLESMEARQVRMEDDLSTVRALLDYARPIIGGARKFMAPGLLAVRGGRKVARKVTGSAPAPDGRPPAPAPGSGPTSLVSDSTSAPSGSALAVAGPSAPAPARRTREREDTRVTGRAPKRIAFYLFFDPDGQVDDYIVYKLQELRKHVDHIFVVSNGPLAEEGRATLESLADTVWERENVGFDVWGYKEAQERFGWDRLAEFDELILLNYTFFGPIFPFGEVFDRMDAEDIDFWGLTEHAEVNPHPHHGVGVMPRHIQSHWIAVRKQMFLSDEYRSYWGDMPMITSYNDSIDRHEARFLQHFEDHGFRSRIAFPLEDYPSDHPIFDDIVLMLRDRLPIVKRRLFFHDPLYLDRFAIIARDAIDEIEASDYPSDLIWRNIVRGAKPRVLATNLTLNEVLPLEAFPAGTAGAFEPATTPSIAVVCHLYYDELVGEILDAVATLPGAVDLYITTTDDAKRERIERAIADAHFPGASEVRVIESNRGRDISAFLVGCGDVLRDERYELIVKIHGKKSAQDGYNAGTWFKRHLMENLLASPGYARNLIGLFQRYPSLGMVFPPVIHMGYPTMGHAWFANKEPAKKFAKRLGITVPFDDTTPLSAYGSMFVARREAVAPLAELGLSWNDFPEEGGYADGTLAHVIERMFSYVALGGGFHIRTVMSPAMAAINYSFLEYKYQAVSSYLPAFGIEQVPYLEATQGSLAPSPLAVAKRLIASKPGAANALRPIYARLRGAYRRFRRS